MNLSRTQKQTIVSNFKTQIANTSGLLVIQNHSLTVEQTLLLRRSLKSLGATVCVVKNTLARIALENHALKNLAPLIKQNSMIVIGHAIHDYIKVVQKLIKDLGSAISYAACAVANNEDLKDGVYEPNWIESMAKHPTSKEMRTTFLYNILSIREKFVRIVEAIKQNRENDMNNMTLEERKQIIESASNPGVKKILTDLYDINLDGLMELLQLMEKMGISVATSAPIATGAGDTAVSEEAQNQFDIKLKAFKADAKSKVILAIKKLFNLTLAEAKGIVEKDMPVKLEEGCTKDRKEEILTALKPLCDDKIITIET